MTAALSVHERNDAHADLDAPDLAAAIRQQISLGHRDPLAIYRKIEDLYGTEWLTNQLFAYREDIVSEIARHELGNQRRTTFAAVARRKNVRKHEKLLATVFVPGAGAKALGDCTVDDLHAVVGMYDRIEQASRRYRLFYEDVLARMAAQGAATVRELKGALPDVPAADLEAGN